MIKFIDIFRFISDICVVVPIVSLLLILVYYIENRKKTSYTRQYTNYTQSTFKRISLAVALFFPLWICGIIIDSGAIKIIGHPLEAEDYESYYYVLISTDDINYIRQVAKIQRLSNEELTDITRDTNYFLMGAVVNGKQYILDDLEYCNVVTGKPMLIYGDFYCILTDEKIYDDGHVNLITPLVSIVSFILSSLFFIDRYRTNKPFKYTLYENK